MQLWDSDHKLMGFGSYNYGIWIMQLWDSDHAIMVFCEDRKLGYLPFYYTNQDLKGIVVKYILGSL